MEIWHNNRCSKSRDTLKIIEDHKVKVEIINYLENPPSKEEIKAVLAKLGLKAQDIIRTSESEFKEKYKGKKLSESEWIDVLVKNPKLIERPIVIKGEKAVIGRPPENVLQLL
ncbi:MAG: arsenate reductase (glutaredoxin) [Crocinitomicaceae bacterium]|nr:arsenate reductase (glutaredoxin) [Crocinitomicaceae bacterium]